MKITKSKLKQLIKKELTSARGTLKELREIPIGGGKAMSCLDIKEKIQELQAYLDPRDAPGYHTQGEQNWWHTQGEISDLVQRAKQQNCGSAQLSEGELPPASEWYAGSEPLWEMTAELDEIIPILSELREAQGIQELEEVIQRLQKLREELHVRSGIFEGKTKPAPKKAPKSVSAGNVKEGKAWSSYEGEQKLFESWRRYNK